MYMFIQRERLLILLIRQESILSPVVLSLQIYHIVKSLRYMVSLERMKSYYLLGNLLLEKLKKIEVFTILLHLRKPKGEPQQMRVAV